MGWIKKLFHWLFENPTGSEIASSTPAHSSHQNEQPKPIEINKVILPTRNLEEAIIDLGNGEKFLQELKSIDPFTTKNLTGGEDILTELKKIASQYK